MRTPPGWEEVRTRGARALLAPQAATWVASVLEGGETLYRAAARHPEALELEGRAPVYAIPAPDGAERWVVRHYYRGGAVAPVLGDRHLRLGTPRPFLELEASRRIRERGVETPAVRAGAVYPRGIFYRADLVTVYVEDSVDLAALLFEAGERAPGETTPDRNDALAAAGRLVADLATAGVKHPDLNAGNVLLAPGAAGLRALVLDLDRCRVLPRGRSVPVRPLLDRLERSLRKLAARSERPLATREWATLRTAATED